MENQNLTIKVGTRQTRLSRLVCLVLSIVMILGANSLCFADTTSTTEGYEWTRIKTNDDLKNWLDGAALKGDKDYKTDTDWVRCLIVPIEKKGTTGKYYIDGYRVDGNGNYYLPRVDDNEKFSCADWPVNCGASAPTTSTTTFTTRTGMNTPFIKYRGWDSDNSCYKFAMRMAKDNQLTKSIWLQNLSWYGVAWHAAAYSEFRFCDVDNISGARARGACSVDTMTDISFYFFHRIQGEYDYHTAGQEFDFDERDDYLIGLLHPLYNIPGVNDRIFNHHGGRTISSEKEIMWNDIYQAGFMLFLGKPVSVAMETSSEPLTVGETTVWDGKMVARSAQITVKQGSTLVIDGKCYNNGMIIVDGGTLIVKGVLDMDPIGNESSSPGFPSGAVLVKNGGLLLVENTGCLLQRANNTGVSLESGSTMLVHGSAVFGAYLNIDECSRFESDYGSFVGIGFSPNLSTEQTNYSPVLLSSIKSKYGTDVFTLNNGTQWLKVGNGSAAYFMGGFCAQNSVSIYRDAKSTLYGLHSKNLGATLSSMLVE